MHNVRKVRLVIRSLFIILLVVIVISYLKIVDYDGNYLADDDSDNGSNFGQNSNRSYAIKLSKKRIGKLFNILHDKETVYETVLEYLNVISFTKLIKHKKNSFFYNEENSPESLYKHEINKYLKVNNNSSTLEPTGEFLSMLKNKSDFYTFENRRLNIRKREFKKEQKPVILTAANSEYYNQLQAAIYYVHSNFPDYKLIVYDLGLTKIMRKKVKCFLVLLLTLLKKNILEVNLKIKLKILKKCKCELKTYDQFNIYKNISPHTKNLKTYSWKPLIIQETLNRYETVIYIDSSIKFQSNEIEPVLNACKDVSMLTQYIHLSLPCFTNPKMFNWFGESEHKYTNIYTIDANLILFQRSFLTSLIMKSWLTCALDETCIAPQGSQIYGSFKNWIYGCSICGCHRFDQDALTIITTYFFGHPLDYKTYLPAFSLTSNESYFFSLVRGQSMNYF